MEFLNIGRQGDADRPKEFSGDPGGRGAQQKELEARLHRHAVAAEWGDILRDLDRLQEIQLKQVLCTNAKITCNSRDLV
jgi:hypothetical protein